MNNDLKNKVAFITGGAHGQGRAAAIALAKEGVHIVAFDIAKQLNYPGYKLGSEDDLDSLQKEVQQLGVNCIICKGDVRKDADITAAVSEAQSTFGRLDILFNNAGICAYGLAYELTEEEWDAMIDINLKGAWLAARRIIPSMI
ncbi:MAG TPA: SDR family NAD(P)-dependent oxidoreductase, partial [Chitinophagaceae bacterium]|nr:SDR family NAD(P)-dependent oxidoreductase [Chitinophagaceae bacterium]